jgi:UPF0716 family protein affecting phage T7 exclusion
MTLRRYAGAIVALLIIVEIVVAVTVARAVGWAPTVLLILLLSAAGTELLRREGLAAFRQRGRNPRTPGDLVVGLTAAGLVAVPGFVTGVVGLLALTPPVRSLLRRRMGARTPTVPPRWAQRFGAPPGAGQASPDAHEVIDGSLDDDDPGQP